MQKTAKYKIPSGKLVEVKVEYQKEIENVEILGDFFIHPEESIQRIEESLLGLDVKEDEETIANIIERVVAKNNIEMIGVTPEGIAHAIVMAVVK